MSKPQVSIFGHRPAKGSVLGNVSKSELYRDQPALVPPSREQVDYFRERTRGKLPPSSVFSQGDYKAIEPSGFSINLVNAQVDVRYPIAGNIIWFLNSTNPSDILNIKFNYTGAFSFPFLPGNALFGVPFQNLYISNAAIAGATATLMILTDTPEHPIRVL